MMKVGSAERLLLNGLGAEIDAKSKSRLGVTLIRKSPESCGITAVTHPIS
jgi:hypothetical protein